MEIGEGREDVQVTGSLDNAEDVADPLLGVYSYLTDSRWQAQNSVARLAGKLTFFALFFFTYRFWCFIYPYFRLLTLIIFV